MMPKLVANGGITSRVATWYVEKIRTTTEYLPSYAKYGLWWDDVRHAEEADVKEALRRLPVEVYDARKMRVHRALHLSATQTYLPKEEWTKLENEVPYLDEYLDEVLEENVERGEF